MQADDPRFELLLEALAAEPDPHTTVSDPARAREVHVADSLSGLEVKDLARARRIADIGSGAGFPGLPLAIALPRARVDLIEAAGRKTAVIDRLICAARVENARSVRARVEEWGAVRRGVYDAATARAVASLAVLVEYAAPLLRFSGVLVAWKGALGADELRLGKRAAGQVGLLLEDVLPVEPFEGSRDRRLVVFRKAGDTPSRFPRRPGMAAKRPLVAEESPVRGRTCASGPASDRLEP